MVRVVGFVIPVMEPAQPGLRKAWV